VLYVSQFGEINTSTWVLIQNEIHRLNTKNKDSFDFEFDPRIILIPSQQIFSYSPVIQLKKSYNFFQKIDVTSILGQAEFYIKEYVLSSVIESNVADPQQRMSLAVEAFNEKFLNANLLTRLSHLSKEQFNRPLFKNASGQEVTIDLLSDGEKQLYGRVISLMILNPHNSMILIDEPEISLHPAWQQKIMQIYSKIGKNNQFIVATHSPQIIASVPYQNLILLQKKNNKIISHYPDSPPIGADVNSILEDFMEVKSEFPEKVVELHKAYREKIEKGLEKTDEAENIRMDLLKHESNDSRFMQEMRILMRLRGKK
jgi:predicted ATP-binding protein involved in virulence